MMQKAKYDLSVLLIFFTRPETLEKVFEKVRQARPARLFLACDGPRKDRPEDQEKIDRCKAIVENIDWECEVHKLYSNVNKGCGKGPSDAISWAFTFTDKLLILEDDCVADPTLFPFMTEMLDLYENDERVGFVSGYNHFKDWDCGDNSYCFTKAAATLGWGTWKRVWEKYDYYLKNAEDPYYSRLLKKEIGHRRAGNSRVRSWANAAKETATKKVRYWDIQFGFVKYSQSYLCIVPKGNLIYNIGVGAGSTHTENTKPTKWKLGKILFMPTVPMEFPIKHPEYVICDRFYDEKYFNMMAYPPVIVRYARKIKRRVFSE